MFYIVLLIQLQNTKKLENTETERDTVHTFYKINQDKQFQSLLRPMARFTWSHNICLLGFYFLGIPFFKFIIDDLLLRALSGDGFRSDRLRYSNFFFVVKLVFFFTFRIRLYTKVLSAKLRRLQSGAKYARLQARGG